MSKAERTRELIVEKTAPIFNIKGYAGTSLSDMTEATGLTKGSIYGNFANKDEVALAAYRYNTNLLRSDLNAAMAEKDTAIGKMDAFLGFYHDNWPKIFERGGCAILNSAIEADDNFPFLKSSVQKSIRDWAGRIAHTIEFGKSTGEFRKEIRSVDYAYTMISLIEGAIMLSKITSNHQHLFAALDRISKIIEQEIKK